LIAGTGSQEQQEQKHAINYLSMYDNKLLRTFRGHVGDIVDLSMSPVDDNFLSSSKDRTVRLWNLQQAGCLGKLELPPTVEGAPRATFDSTGLVFGVTAAMAAGSGHVSCFLYFYIHSFFNHLNHCNLNLLSLSSCS